MVQYLKYLRKMLWVLPVKTALPKFNINYSISYPSVQGLKNGHENFSKAFAEFRGKGQNRPHPVTLGWTDLDRE
jgi:hypothetical protein